MQKNAVRSAVKDEPRLLFLGQAGFAILSGEKKRLVIDPYLSDCVRTLEGHDGFKRLISAPCRPEDLQADVIIATHPHLDHFDADAMPALMKDGAFLYASVDCEKLVKEEKLDEARVAYVRPGDRFERAGFGIRFINCDHGEGAPDAVGVLIETDGRRLLFVGDTCLRPDRVPEYLSDGPIDLMAACINGKFGNMDYADCAKLAAVLRPKLTVPCHFGMFASHGGRPDLFYETMVKEYPDLPFLFMRTGEEITL
ncbi:MAG: MBL fold metallo-hydrolase [Lachnospiraceae bacterium]|nr:MBL fold metallo-hydrolase [Lachnospiraceae bacterium]